jgi:outer membrane protein TolC
VVLSAERRSFVFASAALWLVVSLGTPAFAQGPPATAAPTRTLTLDEALSIAEKTSERVAIAEAGVSRADGGKRLARSERMPQLFGAASYDRTLKSEFEGLFEATDPGTDPGGDVDFSNLPFGQANVYRLGLSFSQVLYSGGRIKAQEAQASIRRDSAGLNLDSAQAQNTLDVAEAYYDAALTDWLVSIAEATYAQADKSLAVTNDQHAAGRLSEFELLRARVARDSLQPAVVRSRNNRDVAYLRLKQLLDLPLDQPLALTADLDGQALAPPMRFAAPLAEAESQAAAPLRLAVAQVGNEVKVAEQSVAVARAERKPAISFRSDYGLVDYPDAVPNFTDWRQNWTLGVALSLPILDGGRIKANQAIARAGVEEASANLRLARELDALDRASTRSDLTAARAEWEASGSTIQQAQRAYEIAELRFSEGLSTQLELSDARLQLAQSQVTRAEAARNLQVRRIRFALLPALPLVAASASAVQNASSTVSQTQNRTQTAPAATGAAGRAGTSGGR